jgi:hypothetical protein
VSTKRYRPEKPEDHPEQHPWEDIDRWSTSDAQWCPLCGAIRLGPNSPVQFPDISKESLR